MYLGVGSDPPPEALSIDDRKEIAERQQMEARRQAALQALTCPDCGKLCKSRMALLAHSKAHKPKKPKQPKRQKAAKAEAHEDVHGDSEVPAMDTPGIGN